MLRINDQLLQGLIALRVMATTDISENRLASLAKSVDVPMEIVNDNGALKEYLQGRIDQLRKLYLKKHSFALPSNSVMFSLLLLFSGKPKRIPKDRSKL
jgi:hypothetical protein